jgi:uncharacterized protein DUF4129
MRSFVQGAAWGPAGPWTVRQIHDTVARIAAEPAYGSSARQSLLGRLLRYLWDRLTAFIAFFEGSVNARVALIATVLLVATMIVARVIVARRLTEGRRHRGLGVRANRGENADYWIVARDEAANGRYADACHALYAAVLDTLAREGLVTFHASKTSGDYGRELRRAGVHVVADFRSFARQFDRVIFGELSVNADDYARLRALAERAARVRAAA